MEKQTLLNIKTLRRQRGLTQQELASMLNVNQTRISAYETGRQDPPASKLPTIAQVLGVTVGELFTLPE